MSNKDMHPKYLGLQIDWPLFVKTPFTGSGRDWVRGEEYKWAELSVDAHKVAQMYDIGFLHHNPALEKQNKVGDRLHEMDLDQLVSLVKLLNSELKSRTVSTKDYQEKRCRQSKIADKQRGLIRRFLYSNKWCEEIYYDLRDSILRDKA